MDYHVLSSDDQTAHLRNVLLQAEADHFAHTIARDEVQAQLDSLPAPTGKDDDPNETLRVEGQTRVAAEDQIIAAAEARAEVVKLKLDLAGEPLVPPVADASDETADASAT